MYAPTLKMALMSGAIILGSLTSAHALSASGATTSVPDYWYFSTWDTGFVQISVNSSSDPMINLFHDDGILDMADLIETDDNGGPGFNSYIGRTLSAGDFVLAIGRWSFPASEAIAGVGGGFVSYTISVNGEFVSGLSQTGPETSPVPLPASLPLLLAGFGAIAIGARLRAA